MKGFRIPQPRSAGSMHSYNSDTACHCAAIIFKFERYEVYQLQSVLIILLSFYCSNYGSDDRFFKPKYEGGPKNNRNLNVARELEVVARCAARCRESTQYSSGLPRGVSLG
jgi:hypothetical protein